MDLSGVLRTTRLLGEARIKSHAVPPIPEEDRPETTEDAYLLQAALHNYLVENGQGELAGWKIGATTVTMQDYLGVTEPAYGRIMSGSLIANRTRVASASFCKPGIECEIAVRIGTHSKGGGYTRDTAAGLVSGIMPAIELVENRYGDFAKRGTPTLIADDFFHKACILGDELENWESLDLATIAGSVRINGDEKASGKGAAVMGHPLAAIAWLANILADHGDRLESGEFVLTGSVTPVIWLDSFPCRAEISLEGLDGVSIELT